MQESKSFEHRAVAKITANFSKQIRELALPPFKDSVTLEVLLIETGPRGAQIPPAGAMGTLNRRDINTPASKLWDFALLG